MSSFNGLNPGLSGASRYRDYLARNSGNGPSTTGTQRASSRDFSSPANANILSLLDRQQSEADANEQATLQDRDAALGLLGGQLGERSPEFDSVFESLSADPGDTPFAQMLRSSISDTLANPDVFSQTSIDQFVSRSNEAAARAVEDSLLGTRIDTAQRGVQGGIPQGLEQQLRLQGSADAIAAEGEIRFAAEEARASNLAFAQQLGVNFETATQQARNQRLQALSQFVSEAESRDLELVTGMAEILANTVRENPDYSGYAAILSDVDRQANDMLIQRENLALLREQIRVQESLGLADAGARTQLAQAQLDFNRTLGDLESQIADFERQLGDNS